MSEEKVVIKWPTFPSIILLLMLGFLAALYLIGSKEINRLHTEREHLQYQLTHLEKRIWLLERTWLQLIPLVAKTERSNKKK